jgi:HlyD family secretion protein
MQIAKLPIDFEHGSQRGPGARWVFGGLLGLALTASLLSWGCNKSETAEAAPTVTVQVGSAENQTIERKVMAEATLYPLEQASIVPKINAPIKKFNVNRGSRVHAGDVLAELENQDLLATKQENEGNYAQAEASYQQATAKAEQDMKLAKQELDSAQKLYDNRQALYKEGAASAKDADDASVALTQARNAYELAQKQLDVKVAQAQLAAAKGKNAEVEAGLSYSQIVSPIDGVVTDRPANPGEMASSSAPLLTVMNVSQVIAKTHIDQQEAASLKVGDAASISVPGQPGSVKGKVSLVSPALDPNSTTVEVWVQAPNPGERLKAGSDVQVQMVAQSIPHAIAIPAEALLGSNGDNSVIILDNDNKPHKKKVKAGIRDGGEVQITEGLQGGERVVTVGAFALSQEDDPILAKTTVQVQAPKMPDEDDDDE